MILKKGVKLLGMTPQIALAIGVVDSVYREHGKDLVVTSVTDGRHGSGSLHYKGLALDCRTRFFDRETALIVTDQCKKRLGGEFDIVLEDDHLHVEWDPQTQ